MSERRVRRDEGEVTSWPRGLVSYTPAAEPDGGPPSEEEDRVAQRIHLAARLIALLAVEGRHDPDWDRELALARAAYRRGDREEAHRRTEALLGALGVAADAIGPGPMGSGPR